MLFDFYNNLPVEQTRTKTLHVYVNFPISKKIYTNLNKKSQELEMEVQRIANILLLQVQLCVYVCMYVLIKHVILKIARLWELYKFFFPKI